MWQKADKCLLFFIRGCSEVHAWKWSIHLYRSTDPLAAERRYQLALCSPLAFNCLLPFSSQVLISSGPIKNSKSRSKLIYIHQPVRNRESKPLNYDPGTRNLPRFRARVELRNLPKDGRLDLLGFSIHVMVFGSASQGSRCPKAPAPVWF